MKNATWRWIEHTCQLHDLTKNCNWQSISCYYLLRNPSPFGKSEMWSQWLLSSLNFGQVWILVQSRTERRIAMHMSPPCIRTGVLKNWPPCMFPSVILLLHHLSKMQLDVDVSPPANVKTFRLGLTHTLPKKSPAFLEYYVGWCYLLLEIWINF